MRRARTQVAGGAEAEIRSRADQDRLRVLPLDETVAAVARGVVDDEDLLVPLSRVEDRAEAPAEALTRVVADDDDARARGWL